MDMTKHEPVSALYDRDFYLWTQHAADRLRNGNISQQDREHLAEEIEDLGKRDWREVNSRIGTIMMHLLKLTYQPEKEVDSRSWVSTVTRERRELALVFEQSPSLRDKGRQRLGRTYDGALRDAAAETGLPRSMFPAECPFTYEQVLDSSLFPDVLTQPEANTAD